MYDDKSRICHPAWILCVPLLKFKCQSLRWLTFWPLLSCGLQNRNNRVQSRSKQNRDAEQGITIAGLEGKTEWDKAVNLVNFNFSRPNGTDLSRFKNVLFSAKSKNVPISSKTTAWMQSLKAYLLYLYMSRHSRFPVKQERPHCFAVIFWGLRHQYCECACDVVQNDIEWHLFETSFGLYLLVREAWPLEVVSRSHFALRLL